MRAFALHLGSGLLGSLSLVLVGCEDPPPPTPAGAFAMTFSKSGPDCNLSTHNAGIGKVGQEGDPDLISDGAGSASIDCEVSATSGGFKIATSMSDGTSLQVTVPSISTDNVDEASGVDGSVSYASSETGGDFFASGSTPCKFWVNPDSQYVKAGTAWVSFVCDSISNEGVVCGINNGFLNVKNCTGAVEEEE
jgi:hypothetical protein